MPESPTRDNDDREPREVHELRERAERAERERDRLRHENERLQRERERLRREVDRLRRQLDEARRAAHRQAAPFAKALTPHPRRPGRKAGAQYGRKARRRRPRRVDETYEAPLPDRCPDCGGPVRETRLALQYQEELPVPCVIVRAFRIHIGHICGKKRSNGRFTVLRQTIRQRMQAKLQEVKAELRCAPSALRLAGSGFVRFGGGASAVR